MSTKGNFIIAVFLFCCTLISSCSSDLTDGEVWIKPDSQTLGCEDYLSLNTPLGMLTNNVWNKNAAGEFGWTQCLETRVEGDTTRYGWSWHWPAHRKVIYAYPQIKLGTSPWAPEPSADPRFPIKIADIKNLIIAYDVEMSTNGQHNLATSMWITNSAEVPANPAPESIVAELMIWTYSTPRHFDPAGRKVGKLIADGVEWEVWVDTNWGDVSGANPNKWTYITYRARKSALAMEYDAGKIIAHALAENFLTPELYIADVELGNEIMSGSGITWIRSFSVNLN